MISRFIKWLRDLAGLDDPPHKIALGLALGIFVGFLPIMGIQMAVVLPIALLFRSNKVAAVAGVWITNPVTVIPIYFLDYLVGVLFTPYEHLTWADFKGIFAGATMTRFLELGESFLVPLFVGGAVIGLVAAFLTYFLFKRFVINYRKAREKLRQLRQRRRERRERERSVPR
jgi:uncharacterized protein (DUF2062 family)